MALETRITGICDRRRNGRKCRGRVVEERIEIPGLIGPGMFIGHKCTRCGEHYTFPPNREKVDPGLKELKKTLKKLLKKKTKKVNGEILFPK
ncbi:MAG: hypothetical protein HYS78_01675 [Parcubacteria group bacterium]|nr:hypothetical protein [Parcubacteria group bacterium]